MGRIEGFGLRNPVASSGFFPKTVMTGGQGGTVPVPKRAQRSPE